MSFARGPPQLLELLGDMQTTPLIRRKIISIDCIIRIASRTAPTTECGIVSAFGCDEFQQQAIERKEEFAVSSRG
jgi:hypothetical protein